MYQVLLASFNINIFPGVCTEACGEWENLKPMLNRTEIGLRQDVKHLQFRSFIRAYSLSFEMSE